MLDIAPGTIMIYSDIGCPWAHVAVWRLNDARRRLGLEGAVSFDHRVPADPTVYDDLLRRAAVGG